MLPSSRLPTAIIQKGLTAKGTFKTWYQNEEFIAKTRNTTPQALRINSRGAQIGSTGIYNTFQITFPAVYYNSFQTNIAQDAIIENNVTFDAYYDTTTGMEVEILFVTDVSTY